MHPHSPNGYSPNGYPPPGHPNSDNSAIRPLRIETRSQWTPQLSNTLNPNYPTSNYQDSGQHHLSISPQKPDTGVTGMLDQTASIELTQQTRYSFNPITGKSLTN